MRLMEGRSEIIEVSRFIISITKRFRRGTAGRPGLFFSICGPERIKYLPNSQPSPTPLVEQSVLKFDKLSPTPKVKFPE